MRAWGYETGNGEHSFFASRLAERYRQGGVLVSSWVIRQWRIGKGEDLAFASTYEKRMSCRYVQW